MLGGVQHIEVAPTPRLRFRIASGTRLSQICDLRRRNLSVLPYHSHAMTTHTINAPRAAGVGTREYCLASCNYA